MSTSGISSGDSGLITPETIDTSGGLTSGSTLTNDGAGGTLQLTGLASGINTTELIQAELAEQELPLDNVEDEISSLNTENSTLSSVQDSLQTVSLDALLLGEPSLFFPVQNISSSDSSLVTAATTSGVGAVIGSNTVTVTALASAAQTTFDWTGTSSTGADTLTINLGVNGSNPTQVTINTAAGATAEQVAEAINGDSSLGVYATYQTTSDGQQQLILSSASTGTGNEITASDSQGVLSEVSGTQQDGTDATYYLNGSTTPSYSASDTVTDAIAGVTLTLLGVTGDSPTDNPVTITTQPPGPNTQSILSAVNQFVSDYNNAISALDSDVNTAPASESTPSDYNPYSGSLFGDDQLENLMGDMRTALYQNYSGTGIVSGMTSLDDIGISTGTPTGTASSSTVAGELTVNTSQLTAAIESDPSGVQSLIDAWSQNFQSVVNAAASPVGSIESRIDGNDTLVSSLSSQLSSQEALYATEEQNMEEQWAQVEATLEDLDDQKSSLSTFTDSLSSSSSSS